LNGLFVPEGSGVQLTRLLRRELPVV
jgi:hypothetical protein